MGLDWGSVPDWVGAVGSTVALATTGYVLTNRLAQRDKRREVRVDYRLAPFAGWTLQRIGTWIFTLIMRGNSKQHLQTLFSSVRLIRFGWLNK
jgi:hypothetical protein